MGANSANVIHLQLIMHYLANIHFSLFQVHRFTFFHSSSPSLSRSLGPSSSASRHSSWHKRKCDKCLLMSNNVTIMPELLYPKDVRFKTNDQDNRYIRTWLCFWEQMWRICLFRPGWSKDNSSCFSSKAKISFKFKNPFVWVWSLFCMKDQNINSGKKYFKLKCILKPCVSVVPSGAARGAGESSQQGAERPPWRVPQLREKLWGSTFLFDLQK